VQDRESDIIEQSVAFWRERTEQPVTPEDVREMLGNVSGFFRLLAEWERQAHQGATTHNA
jgi:hypothetical protein